MSPNEFVSEEGLSLREISRILEAEVLSGEAWLDQYVVKKIAATDLMSGVLAHSQPGTLLLTNLSNIQVVNTAGVAGLSGVVFLCGARPPGTVIQKAETLELATMVTGHNTLTACGLLFDWGGAGP
ncbi:MAG: DRTGG domain-containing protein [Thermodesulfobacteriota bacterium]